MAMHERRETPHGEAHPRRDTGERREQRHRLEARLREQAVADPQRVEDAGMLGGDGDVEEILRLDRADDDGAVRQDEAERGTSRGRHGACCSSSVMRLKNWSAIILETPP